jgi:eukaryotic-like serine/threonine-protein kinase
MALSVGTKLGAYEIIAPLGAGGMGEVYRAHDSKLGRDVAVKVLPEAFARDPERLGRFAREAQVLGSLNHPNIAAIYGFEDSSNVHALVMELVEGPTLAERIAKAPIPLAEALPIARQICEALEYAHERGVVHRDLKPANVKITPDGTVKLLDFGLAKALELRPVSADIATSPTITNMATQAGAILGTPAYMSPEQAKGRPLDRRVDIWAFGSVLYEMLTGKMVFSGESASDTIAEIIKSDPEWSLLPADTPKPIRTLIQRCLKKDLRQRLQAIGEARIVIEEVLAGKEPADTAENESARALMAAAGNTRHSVAAWIGGIFVGALLAAAFFWWTARSAPAPAAMHFSTVTSFAGVQAQPALSPDGRSVAFVSNRDGHYNVYVGLVRGGELVQVTHGTSMKSRPSWSPDGSTLAYAQMNDSGTMDVWEISALGGSPRKVLLNANDPTWTPDGRSLVYQNAVDSSVWTSGLSGDNPHLLVQMAPGLLAAEPRISPDGRLVAISVRPGGAPYGELAVADVTSGKVRMLTNDHALALSPAWSPDSRFIYFSSSRGGTLNIWKIAADGSALRQITAGEGDDAELDVSSDGKRLIFATARLHIGLTQLDLQSKSGDSIAKALALDSARNEFGPAYSPDGARIAFFTNLKGVENESIGVADVNGANATLLVRDSRINVFPRWSPDGTRILYLSYVSDALNSGEYRSIAISGGAPQTLLAGRDLSLFGVGRDGRLLFSKGDGAAQSFDSRDGKTLTLGNVPKTAQELRWSADGTAVAYIILPQQNDPDAGIWVTDFKTPPRPVFRGFVCGYAVDEHNEITILKGKADLSGELWKVKWDGSVLSRAPATVPLLYNFNYLHAYTETQFDISHDGRRVVFQSQQVLQENIGIIDNLP